MKNISLSDSGIAQLKVVLATARNMQSDPYASLTEALAAVGLNGHSTEHDPGNRISCQFVYRAESLQ
jgi:hypothetical protein